MAKILHVVVAQKDMRTCWSLRFLLFLMGYMAIMCGSVVPAHARSLAEIRRTKEIRICISPINPLVATVEPAVCREHCKFSGPVYERAMAFAETFGKDVKPKFLRVEWDEQFFNKEGETVREESYTPELLASGTCDFYPILTKLPWCLNKLDFVILYPNRLVVIVHKSKKAAFKTAADLGGKVTATLKDTSWHTWLQEQNENIYAANPIQIKFVTTEDEVLKAVEEGRIDFMVTLLDNALWYTRHQAKNSIVAFAVGPLQDNGWAFRKQDKDLQAAVQTFFETQRAAKDSTLNKNWKNTYGITLIDFITLVTSLK